MKNSDFQPIFRFISETIQNMAIITMKDEWELVRDLSDRIHVMILFVNILYILIAIESNMKNHCCNVLIAGEVSPVVRIHGFLRRKWRVSLPSVYIQLYFAHFDCSMSIRINSVMGGLGGGQGGHAPPQDAKST